MALKIRLRQQGRKNHHTFRLVVADVRSPRDGKYLENLGYYDPRVEGDKQATLFDDRIQYWLDQGAEITTNAVSLVKRLAPHVIEALEKKQEAKKEKVRQERKSAKTN